MNFNFCLALVACVVWVVVSVFHFYKPLDIGASVITDCIAICCGACLLL